MAASPITLAQLNRATKEQFVAVCGPLFEHSPWIAERTFAQRDMIASPIASREELHRTLCEVLHAATLDEQLQLIAAHPDLVGCAALAGTLTSESTREQSAAGLGQLTADELALFQRYNAEYRQKFCFPFVICARLNKKEAILAAFPARLSQSRNAEIKTALGEIEKIAWLRLQDAVTI